MFESICFRRQSNDDPAKPLDLGFLAETMLFYERVHLIADYSVLEQLVRHCGPDLLLALVDEGFLTIHYLNSMTAVKTENVGTTQEKYWPVTAQARSWMLQEAVPHIFQQITGKTGKGRRLGNRFAEKIRPIIEDQEIFTAVRADYANTRYVKESVKRILQMRVPEYQLPRNFHFHMHDVDDKFLGVETNLDFVLWNGALHLQTASGPKPISPGHLLADLFEARRDLHFSSLYGGEIATTPISSALIRIKCEDLLSSRQRNAETIALFQDQTLEQGHAIRDVINSGECDFKEVLHLLQASRKFRHWLHQQDPDINLIKAYYKEVTQSTWVESHPVRAFRWFFLLAVNLALIPVNPIVGVGISSALSAADTFLLERLIRGWKPNQFVEGPLKEFIEKGRQLSSASNAYV